MNRRNFFKVLGGAALAMVGVRSVKARVCERQNGFLDRVYPVDSIYISTDSANPGPRLGGTWVRFGQGRTLVSQGTSDRTFSTGETGGASTHTLTEAQMPSHAHMIVSGTGAGGAATWEWPAMWRDGCHYAMGCDQPRRNTQNTGGGQAHNNLPPYITVFMWRRSA